MKEIDTETKVENLKDKTEIKNPFNFKLLPRALQKQSKNANLKSIEKKINKNSSNSKIITAELLINEKHKFTNIQDTLLVFDVEDPYDPLIPNLYVELIVGNNLKQQNESKKMEENLSNQPLKKQKLNAENVPISLFAEKMLYKQGWKGTGYGLGKDDQGISTPLIGSKLSESKFKDSGVSKGIISHANLVKNNMSRLILIRNIVDFEHAENSILEETCQICEKFGRIISSHIDKPQPDHKSDGVRLFILFENITSSKNARESLARRSFDGKPVKISFYSEAAYFEHKYRLPVEN